MAKHKKERPAEKSSHKKSDMKRAGMKKSFHKSNGKKK